MTYLRPADRDTEIRVDPIKQFEKFMAERLKIGDETISASKQTAAEIIDAAVEYALQSEDPSPALCTRMSSRENPC